MVGMRIRAFRAADVPRMREIWNEVVRAGNAFPQFAELADDEEAEAFFASQTRTAVAVDCGELGADGYGESDPGRRNCAEAETADAGTDAASGEAPSAQDGRVVGLYILHPNNIGRCAHTANTSYAVDSSCRRRGVGRALVQDSLDNLKPCGFRGLQFNAVVASNVSAIRLYESMGFDRIGVIPGGFLNGEGVFEDMIIFHHPA